MSVNLVVLRGGDNSKGLACLGAIGDHFQARLGSIDKGQFSCGGRTTPEPERASLTLFDRDHYQ